VRLWQKIFLLTLALVIAVVNATSFFLLTNNHRLVIERDQADALARHSYLVVEMQNSIIYTQLVERLITLDETEVLSVAREAINRQRSDSAMGAVLFRDGAVLHSINQDGRPFNAQHELLALGDYSSRIIDYGQNTYLLLVSSFKLNDTGYQLVTSLDITSTYQLFQADLNLVRLIGVVSALIVAGILLLLVLGLLRPLRNLSLTTSRIAQGELRHRADVHGNDEVSDVAINLNIMADSIEHNVNALTDLAESRRIFIGNLAHEMKTPLTSILGFADILLIKRTVSDSDRREYASIIVSETKRLQGLSGKLMELLSIGSIHPSFEAVDLKALSDEICVALQPLMERADIRLINKINAVRITVDKDLLQILLTNLIDNAAKASLPGSSITLSAKPEPEGKTRVCVTDEGSGIPADQIPMLTEPFYMLDKARTRSSGGAGLGLALCAEIARVHGADLKIESELGSGTSVHVIFLPEPCEKENEHDRA
jgi:signal transduction histidine kinase